MTQHKLSDTPKAPVPKCTSFFPPSTCRDFEQALAIDPGVAPGESGSRAHALNRAITRAKLLHPELFR